MTKEEIIQAIETMSVLELSELVKALEEKFGVSASAAPMMMAAMPGAAAPAAAAEEKTEFDVVYKGPGANKIAVIKVVRESTTRRRTSRKACRRKRLRSCRRSSLRPEQT